MLADMNNFNELLRYFRKRAGLSLVGLANKIGVTANYIGNIEKKYSRPPTMERCRELAAALDLNDAETELFINTAMEERLKTEHLQWIEGSKVYKVPLISWVHANKLDDIHDPFPPGHSDIYVTTTTKGEHMFALKVKSSCMEPEFAEGDIIIVDPNAEAHPGDYVVVKDLDSNEATFKQLKKKGNKIILHPLNPKYDDIELDPKKRYTVVGKVVEKIKKY